ncbi:MAG: DUF4352 domain-containing protein [Acidobacteria bacterium]|nr:DUF4352 domain-containing protein [Acidobacteriota bacterium]
MGVILMVMTIGGLIVAAVLLIISRVTKKVWLKHFVFGGLTTWFAAYIFLLFCGSFFSVERTLDLNEPKEFCGFYFDCHMHTAVADVRKTKTLGDETANGEFYVVNVKVSSDARRAELGLTAPKFQVIDDAGRRYERVEDLTASGNPFEQKVPAGGAFEGEIVFDLPIDVKNPRLDIREGYGIDHIIEAVLIGDEDSIGHKRNYFKLDASNQVVQK